MNRTLRPRGQRASSVNSNDGAAPARNPLTSPLTRPSVSPNASPNAILRTSPPPADPTGHDQPPSQPTIPPDEAAHEPAHTVAAHIPLIDHAGSNSQHCGERYAPHINEPERNSKYDPEYEAEREPSTDAALSPSASPSSIRWRPRTGAQTPGRRQARCVAPSRPRNGDLAASATEPPSIGERPL